MIDFEMETLERCPVCGSESIRNAFSAERKSSSTLYISQCNECKIIFLNPRMTDEQTKRYYSGVYRDTIQENVGGISQKDLDTQQIRATVHAEMLGLHIHGIKSCLEIGSSGGYLLDQVHKMGAKHCVGIEPDERYHHILPAKKYKMYRDISELERQKFDLICMSHSLEHLNHPSEYIFNLVSNYAHQDTLFFIEVPDTDYYQCFGIAHPINFTQATLNELFERLKCKTIVNYGHGLGQAPLRKFLVGIYKVN